MLPSRPPLNLGSMTGDRDYIRARSLSLVSTFSTLLGKNLRLVDGPVGMTDTESFIQVPLSDPEGYLVTEHELSHCLFGTDLGLTDAFRDRVVERLLRRAGIPRSHPDAAPYKSKLDKMVHHLWNIIEDHRCRWLWEQLYPGGGELLKQRWEDICKYEADPGKMEKDLVSHLSSIAAGVPNPLGPPEFQACNPYMEQAVRLVEGVDAAACLGIVGRMIDNIADELLDQYKPDLPQPQQQPSSGTGGQAQQSGGQQPQTSKGGDKKTQKKTQTQKKENQGRRKPGDGKKKEEQAKQKLETLIGAISDKANNQPDKNDAIGSDSVCYNPAVPKAKQRPTAQQVKAANRILTARDNDENPDYEGMSSFDALIHKGASKMQQRLDEARKAMAEPKMTKSEEARTTLLGASKVAGIEGFFVTPQRDPRPPTELSHKVRKHLERVRMKRRSRMVEDGDEIDIPAYLGAKFNRELDGSKLFWETKQESGMELLLLIDVSGSMLGFGLDLMDLAISDVYHACKPLKVKLHLWGYSHYLYFFEKVGSPREVPGVSYGATHTVQALEVAAQWAKKSTSRRAIILITDGYPTTTRTHNSTGDIIGDLHNVLDEMRRDRITLSILAIGSNEKMYDRAFRKGKYSLLPNVGTLATALPNMAKVLVEANMQRTR